jgi:phosphatidate cytidylyltransferase
MSSAHQAARVPGGARVVSKASIRARRFYNELGVRALFGALLALAAAFVTFVGGYLFAGFIALAAFAAAREWLRMVGTQRFGWALIISCAAIAAASIASLASSVVYYPPAILAVGAALAAAVSVSRGGSHFWSGLGVLYIGIPAWSLVAMREHSPRAQWIVLGVFLTIWTADTGALLVGKTLGGPKLLPSLSPNKTWAGLAGGLLLPGMVVSLYVYLLGGNALSAFAIAVVLAATGHGGDLFESWIKRRVGRKNSGGLIPGHGGVLDRLDSTLFVAPAAAALIALFGVYGLFGVHA